MNVLITEVVGSDDDAEFNAWCDKLDSIGRKQYGLEFNYTANTGRDCWRENYDSGQTPEEVIAEDIGNS